MRRLVALTARQRRAVALGEERQGEADDEEGRGDRVAGAARQRERGQPKPERTPTGEPLDEAEGGRSRRATSTAAANVISAGRSSARSPSPPPRASSSATSPAAAGERGSIQQAELVLALRTVAAATRIAVPTAATSTASPSPRQERTLRTRTSPTGSRRARRRSRSRAPRAQARSASRRARARSTRRRSAARAATHARRTRRVGGAPPRGRYAASSRRAVRRRRGAPPPRRRRSRASSSRPRGSSPALRGAPRRERRGRSWTTPPAARTGPVRRPRRDRRPPRAAVGPSERHHPGVAAEDRVERRRPGEHLDTLGQEEGRRRRPVVPGGTGDDGAHLGVLERVVGGGEEVAEEDAVLSTASPTSTRRRPSGRGIRPSPRRRSTSQRARVHGCGSRPERRVTRSRNCSTPPRPAKEPRSSSRGRGRARSRPRRPRRSAALARRSRAGSASSLCGRQPEPDRPDRAATVRDPLHRLGDRPVLGNDDAGAPPRSTALRPRCRARRAAPPRSCARVAPDAEAGRTRRAALSRQRHQLGGRRHEPVPPARLQLAQRLDRPAQALDERPGAEPERRRPTSSSSSSKRPEPCAAAAWRTR